jgi:hypothetical protein
MISFGLRWRLARGASSLLRQVSIGVIATAIASVVLPIGARSPASAPPEPKISLRIEPEAQPKTLDRRLIQQASEVVDAEPAAVAETHMVKSASHKPKHVVAMLPPVRPRETPEILAVASEPAAEAPVSWDWLATPRAAVDVTASAFDASKRWALEGKDWASQAASGATTVLSQAVRFGP